MSLSDKVKKVVEGGFEEGEQVNCYKEEDVQEFIKELKELNKDYDWINFEAHIDELAGDKLIGGEEK